MSRWIVDRPPRLMRMWEPTATVSVLVGNRDHSPSAPSSSTRPRTLTENLRGHAGVGRARVGLARVGRARVGLLDDRRAELDVEGDLLALAEVDRLAVVALDVGRADEDLERELALGRAHAHATPGLEGGLAERAHDREAPLAREDLGSTHLEREAALGRGLRWAREETDDRVRRELHAAAARELDLRGRGRTGTHRVAERERRSDGRGLPVPLRAGVVARDVAVRFDELCEGVAAATTPVLARDGEQEPREERDAKTAAVCARGSLHGAAATEAKRRRKKSDPPRTLSQWGPGRAFLVRFGGAFPVEVASMCIIEYISR